MNRLRVCTFVVGANKCVRVLVRCVLCVRLCTCLRVWFCVLVSALGVAGRVHTSAQACMRTCGVLHAHAACVRAMHGSTRLSCNALTSVYLFLLLSSSFAALALWALCRPVAVVLPEPKKRTFQNGWDGRGVRTHTGSICAGAL